MNLSSTAARAGPWLVALAPAWFVYDSLTSKLNVPLPPNADDGLFFRLWPAAERFLDLFRPQFVLLQCGADCLAGDPITHLRLSTQVHREVTAALCRLSDRHCEGRLLALGGGGYDRAHTAQAWTSVVSAMIDNTPGGPGQ